MRRLAVVVGIALGAALVGGWWLESPGVAVLVVASVPALVDLGLLLTGPIERGLGRRWVHRAARSLSANRVRIVGITGSYGKTTTKAYVAHLLTGRWATVASPASFNNRMGLARAVNEHVSSGTEVFVAEMGTYGAGEIADMCRWFTPEVAVITNIGPVHLERFGSEERIVAAKREILERARVAVIGIDHPLLLDLARSERAYREVIGCSALSTAEVMVVEGTVAVGGTEIGRVDPSKVLSLNLACAVGAALALGMAPAEIAPRLGHLPTVPHRRQVLISERGPTIIDDTYNSNPAGARAALQILASMNGRKVVVTPGMVELGQRQDGENRSWARDAAAVADDLVVVGVTNRSSLVRGAGGGRAVVTVLPNREAAVEWVRSRLGPGDSVLYENDLPDHYP
jgi:UDP-N-acetylmuramoyl-tripeptide--D-alanyl-D-alanine ligase